MDKILVVMVLAIGVFTILGCEQKDYFHPKSVQVSDCNLDGEDFVEVICKENGIDPNSYYRIECPKCPSGRYIPGTFEKKGNDLYEKPNGGAYIERNPEATEMYLFHSEGRVIEDSSDGETDMYCGRCGYQIGSDWTIFEIDPNDFYRVIPSNGERLFNEYKVYKRAK